MKKELKNLIDTIKKSGEDLRTKCEDHNSSLSVCSTLQIT